MPQTDIDRWFEAYDEEYAEVDVSTPIQNVRSLSDVLSQEKSRTEYGNKRRMGAAPETTFGSQLIWGLAESAMVAPSLWESLGKQAGMDVGKGDIKQALLGEEAGAEWEDMTGTAKAGYIVGAGAGMFIPFGLAGKAVSKVLGVGGKAVQGTQRALGYTSFLTRASEKEIAERVGVLTGKKATKLSQTTDVTKITAQAEKAVGKGGEWNALRNYKEGTDAALVATKAEIKAGLEAIDAVPAAAIDDITEIAYEAVKYNSPGNAHAILESAVKALPGGTGMTGSVLAAMSYDALLGTTYGFARAMANDYANQAWSEGKGGELGFSAWNPDTAHAFSEAMTEGAWLSLLGPVRMITGGTGRPLLTVPRFWNKNPGVVNKIVGGVAKSWTRLGKIDPPQAEATLAMMHHISGGAIKNYTRSSPLLKKAFKDNPSEWWTTLKGKDLVTALRDVRKGFTKHAPMIIGKEVGADLLGSIPRMGIGAVAMNASAVVDVWNQTKGLSTSERVKWTAGSSFGEGFADTAANVLVAALMMRQGRAYRRFGEPSTLLAQKGRKPMMMDKFKGQDTFVSETIAGLDKLGMHPAERYNFAQIYHKAAHFPDHYADALAVNMLETNPEYKYIGESLKDKLLTEKDAQDLNIEKEISEGKHPDVETALRKVFADESVPLKKVKELAEDYAVYRAIVSSYEVLAGNGKKLTMKPITTQDAVQLVGELANMKIDGKKVTRKNVSEALSLLQKKAVLESVNQMYSPMIESYYAIAQKLGLENVVRDHDRGVILIPEGLSLARTPKETGTNEAQSDMSNMIESFNYLTKVGKHTGWLMEQKGVPGSDNASGDMYKEALDIFNETVLEQHKMVYGYGETRKSLEKATRWDGSILTNNSWHQAFLRAKKFTQGQDVNAFMNGDYDSISSNKDSNIVHRIGEKKAPALFGTGRAKLKTEDTKGKTQEEINELEEFVSNFNKLYAMSRPMKSATGSVSEITIPEAVEFKRDIEMLFGDAFSNKDAFSHIEKVMLEGAIDNIDLKGVKSDLRKGVVSLLSDTHFSPGVGVLRSKSEINDVLDVMSQAEGKSEAEVRMIKDWYDNVLTAVRNSDSQVVKIGGEHAPITEAMHQSIWDSLTRAEHHARMEDVKLVIDDSIDIDYKIRFAVESVNRKVEGLLDKETGAAVKSDLFKLLSKDKDSLVGLSEQINLAIKEDNIPALRTLTSDQVNILDYVHQIENGHTDTAKDIWHQELFRIAEKIGELNSSLERGDVERINEERIKLHDVEAGVPRDSELGNKISAAQFLGKYMTNTDNFILLEKALHESWQTDNSAIKLLKTAREQVVKANEIYDTQLDLTVFDNAIRELEAVTSTGGKLDADQIVDFLYEPMYNLVKANLDTRLGLGKNGGIDASRHAELAKDLYIDLFQVMTNAYSTKQVRMFEYYQGGFNLSHVTVPNTDRNGFLGIEALIPGLQGNIFILKNSAVTADGSLRTQMTSDVIEEIQSRLKIGKVKINSLDARKRMAEKKETDLDAVEEGLVGSIHGRDFTIVRLDEGTDLILEMNQDSYAVIKNAFHDPNSLLMERLKRAIGSEHFDSELAADVTNESTGFSREIRNGKNGLDQFINLEFTKEGMAKAVFLARMIVDSALSVEPWLLGKLTDTEIKAEWKRLKMSQPKSGFYGSEDNVAFVYKMYDKMNSLTDDIGIQRANQKLRDVFGENGDGTLNLVTLNDEQADAADTGRYNPFSYKATALRKLNEQFEQGISTEAEFLNAERALKKVPSTVDSITYLTRDTYEALMALLGVKDSMIRYTDDGMVISAGALKPVITLSQLGADGRALEFLLKTSFQYDPAIAGIIPEGAHGIAFSSGAKKFKTRVDRGAEVLDGYHNPPLVDMDGLGRPTWRKTRSALNGHTSDNIARIPLSAINIKQASREHTGSFSANTAVHFSEYGMTGANRWSAIQERMRTFQERIGDVYLSPYSQTAAMRKLTGYSREIGDTYLVNTGLDYIIQKGGVLSSEWMLPIIEKQVVSAYLNGGNITATPIYESSSDVMAPEGDNLSSPLRTKINFQVGGGSATDKPVQRAFGGTRISQFNASKKLKVWDNTHELNSKPGDTHALVTSFKDGKEGVMVEGKEPTLYVDGLMIKRINDEIVMYDMSRSMEEKASLGEDLYNTYADKFEQAEGLRERFNEAIDYENNRDMSFSDAMLKAEGITDNDKRRVWLATLSTRQPRNQAGDLVIMKAEGITSDRGNVAETNILDAYQVLDSDNDFDKMTTYTASDGNVWGEALRLAGYTTFNKEVDISNYIDKILAPFSTKDGLFDTIQKDNIVSTNQMRSRLVKQHQTLTYLNNVFGDSPIMTFKFKGDKNRLLGIKLRQSESAYLNTEQTLSKFVKHFIDVYKETPQDYQSNEFIKDAFRRIYFHPTEGIFEVYDAQTAFQPMSSETMWNARDGKVNAQYIEVMEIIERRIFRPLNRYVQYNRGQDMLERDGYSRPAGVNEFSSAYENLLFAFNPGRWDGIQAEGKPGALYPGISMLNMTPAMKMARHYFAERSGNPFDMAMRKMHNIQAKKNKDIDFFQSDIGNFIRMIENGHVGDAGFESRRADFINRAFQQYVKNEMSMYNVISLMKREKFIDYRLSELEHKYRFGDETLEYGNLLKQKERLAETVKDLRQVMGAGSDWENAREGNFGDMDMPFKFNKLGNKLKGEFTNRTGKPLVIRNIDGSLSEVIPKGKTNQNYISKKMVGFKHGRKFEFSAEDRTGAYINREAFGGHPTVYEGGEIIDRLEDGQWAGYTPWFKVLRAKLTAVDNDFVDKLGRRITNRMSPHYKVMNQEKKRTLHEMLKDNNDVHINEDSSFLSKYAFFHKMMAPKIDKSTILAFPVHLGGKKTAMANMEKVEMHDFGRIEQLAWEYLKNVSDSKETKIYHDGILTADEATRIMDNIIWQRDLGLLKLQNAHSDYRLAMHGFASSDVAIKDNYLYSDIVLNQSIFDKTRVTNEGTRNAANVLVRYATGDAGLVDPATVYRASRQLIQSGVKAGQTFMELGWKENPRAFGDPIPKGFTMLNQKRRNTGGEGIITESPLERAKEITRCLKKN